MLHSKKIFITILLAVYSLGSHAQAVTKKILVEHFTNTKCSVCASRNPGFYTALAQNPDVLHLAYHPSSPYNTCLFSTQNKVENDARTNYYGLFGGTPTFTINGIEKSSSAVQSSAIYNPFKNQTSPLSIALDLRPAGSDSIEISVVITSVANHNFTNLLLYVPLAEDSVFYNAPNGEKVHFDVFRKSFTGQNPLGFIAPKVVGTTYTYNSKVVKKSIWNLKRLSAIAIISESVDNIIQVNQSKLYNATTSSVTDTNEDENILSIYPNPATNMVHIKREINSGTTDVQIINQLGHLVLHDKNISTDHVVDVSHFATGIYFIRTFEPFLTTTRKLIKL